MGFVTRPGARRWRADALPDAARAPNIDRVAQEGIDFTDYYGQQSCTAGRAAFITGQSPMRTGLLKVGLPGAKEGLSEKDPTYVLPILMTATMFIQTYITPTTGDPAQRKIFLIMPLVFGFLFKDFPSGLVLYWLVQNVLTIIQQLIMNKWWKDHPDSGDGGTPAAAAAR